MELGFNARPTLPTENAIADVGNFGTLEMPPVVAEYQESSIWGPGTELGDLEEREL